MCGVLLALLLGGTALPIVQCFRLARWLLTYALTATVCFCAAFALYPAAGDVLRFLMLTYTLTVPGWVGRKTLLRLRGVPQNARQTVSNQGKLSELVLAGDCSLVGLTGNRSAVFVSG